MKFLLYQRLAIDGIRKNKKLYLPYILTCIGTVMMAYILQSLSYSPALHRMKGGDNLELVLTLGKLVMVIFSALFLLYTNSFLIRRRYREFGLYHVLGMGKSALRQLILWESLMVAAIAIGFGIGLGIVFSKLAELGLVNAVHAETDYIFTISGECVLIILMLFVPIFIILTFKSLIQVSRTDPLALLQSETTGEKPPKANYLLAIAGLILLAGAYFMAVSIQNPMQALVLFFVAVVMVIVATYLLCISGSVTLCRLLQKRKRFYYHKDRFVSISTMVYRMKRNGAGLASICILSTMVLVMLTSTSSLYFGTENSIAALYPNEAGIAIHTPSLEYTEIEQMKAVHDSFNALLEEKKITPANILQFRYASITGLLTDDRCEPNMERASIDALTYFKDLRTLFFIPLADYNACTGAGLSLEPGQAMLGCTGCQYELTEFSIGALSFEIVGEITEQFPISEAIISVTPTMYLVISDLAQLCPLEKLADYKGIRMLKTKIYFGCDPIGLSNAQIIDLYSEMKAQIHTMDFLRTDYGFGWTNACRAEARNDFYGLYGGLFFLGILLSILFLSATVLIVYYKQICEGYEDQSRYAIMRKIGMTKDDIRRNVNSQILTVFFIPLILAGIHLAFAFPMVWKLLMLFNLRDMRLAVGINIAVYLTFCVFYGIIYKFTAGAYYSIVSSSKKA